MISATMRRLFLLGGLLLAATAGYAQTPPYLDYRLNTEQRVNDLMGRLTLEEKVSLMMNESPAIERLGIPAFHWWNEALHGVARNGTATVFPITMAMAASWDDALLHRVFTAVSDEARAKHQQALLTGKVEQYQGLSFWTPNINIFRDPRWGRGQETYGEDPYLTSQMGMAVVRGLQGSSAEAGELGSLDDSSQRKGKAIVKTPKLQNSKTPKYYKTLACAKHFAVHSGPEWNRHTFNVANLPERDLWETYLPAFKALVQEAHVAEVMCAYQRIDGQPCCSQHRYEHQILRQEWGFQGLITSDCGAIWDFLPSYHNVSPDAIDASAKAVRAGTDLECGNAYSRLPQAVRQGKVSEDEIDTSLRRLLQARMMLGDFDPDSMVAWTALPDSVIDAPSHRQLALQMAREGIVLLQNNGILPLRRQADGAPLDASTMVVMGPNANDSVMMWGNYAGTPSHTVTILEGLRQQLGPSLRYVTEADWAPATDPAQTVIYVGGISPRLEGEQMDIEEPGFRGGDRTTIELPQAQRQLLHRLHQAGKRIILINCSGSAIALMPESRICDAILQAWYGGEEGGTAVADVLTGRYNPTGKLPVTFYKDDSQLPDYEDYTMRGRTYRYMDGEPLFPFGHGLSYTSFALSNPLYKKDAVHVTVTNTGQADGTETVQVYLRRTADVNGPRKSLRAYQRVALKAGESRRVAISLPRNSFETWDEQSNSMRVVAGQYEVMVGTSSADRDQLRLAVQLK